MRVGVDVRTGIGGRRFAGVLGQTPAEVLTRARELGLDGVLFRSVLDLSPTLDPGELGQVRDLADALGMYLELGVGVVNPFSSPENPEIRLVGEGDYRLGMERMIRACAGIGVRELWVATANYKPELPGNFRFDRFRTDVCWSDQLTATEAYLRRLAPVLADLGCHLNLETHEEITTFELVRLCENVGPSVLGIAFDVANVVTRGEDPVAAARRAAPYTRMTHLRDVALCFAEDGLARMLLPCGAGVVDWRGVMAALAGAPDGLNLTIEGLVDSRSEMPVPIHDPDWQRSHPDLTVAELAELVRLAHRYSVRVQDRQAPSLADLRSALGADEPFDFLRRSASFLRSMPGVGAAAS